MDGIPPAGRDYSVLEAFQGTITPPKTSILYLGALLVVAATMLILPVIYFIMMGLVAWVVYYHAVHNFLPIMNFGGAYIIYVLILKVIIYLTPLVAGLVVLFFMFKPLLAGRAVKVQPLALNPASEPVLYAFIEKICGIVGAPSPRRIDLDCQLNAAAGFRRGVRGLFERDLVLVIGLPLVANLSAREFACVIAHEFGHFTQDLGMRLSFIINSVNGWLGRVAYGRDQWDAALECWSEDVSSLRMMLMAWSVRLAVWFSRVILKTLFYAGHFVSSFMSRRMEFDADAYAIKVAGSGAFEQMEQKLAALGAAMGLAQRQISANWKKTKLLPDNFPEVLRGSLARLKPEELKQIDDTLGLRRTRWYDTHPAPADRIRVARQAADPGIFHDDRPARNLFSSFEHPCRFVTLLHYRENLGIPVTEKMLEMIKAHDVAETPEVPAMAAAGPAGGAYFFGLLPLMTPLRLEPATAATNLEADFAEWTHLTTGLRQLAEKLAGIAREDAEFAEKITEARCTRCVADSGICGPGETMAELATTARAAATAESRLLAARAELRASLGEVIPGLRRRLELALALALANVHASSVAAGAGEHLAQLISTINQAAMEFDRRVQLLDALEILERLEGRPESLKRRKAMATQKQLVRELAAQLTPPGESKQPASGARLQIVRIVVPANVEFSAIKDVNQRWFASHYRELDEIVQFASSAEAAASNG